MACLPARSGPGSFVLEAVLDDCHPETYMVSRYLTICVTWTESSLKWMISMHNLIIISIYTLTLRRYVMVFHVAHGGWAMTRVSYPVHLKDTGLTECHALQRPQTQCTAASLARSEGPKTWQFIIVNGYVCPIEITFHHCSTWATSCAKLAFSLAIGDKNCRCGLTKMFNKMSWGRHVIALSDRELDNDLLFILLISIRTWTLVENQLSEIGSSHWFNHHDQRSAKSAVIIEQRTRLLAGNIQVILVCFLES